MIGGSNDLAAKLKYPESSIPLPALSLELKENVNKDAIVTIELPQNGEEMTLENIKITLVGDLVFTKFRAYKMPVSFLSFFHFF